LPTLTVEIAFATDPDSATPAWQNVTSYVRGFSIRRGRERDTDLIRPGTCDLELNNGDRRFDAAYSYSPYFPNVLPMRRLRVSAVWNAVTYYLFNGLIERWPLSWDQPKWGTVSVVAADDMASLEGAIIAGSFPQETTGARISRVLTAAGWPASAPQAGGYWTLGTSQLGTTAILSYGLPNTLLDTGQEQVQAVAFQDTDEQTALNHIQDVVTAERGAFFIDGQGRAVFLDRKARYNAASEVTFAETSLSSSRIPYHDLQPDFSVDRVVNEAKVTRNGGTTQTASDGMSRQKYRRRTMSLEPPLVSDTSALNRANLEVKLRKDPRLEFDAVVYKPIADDNSWPHALGRELGDRVALERTPGADGVTSETISRSCFVESIEHQASGREWVTSHQLSPAAGYDQFFELGTAALGSSSTAVLAY